MTPLLAAPQARSRLILRLAGPVGIAALIAGCAVGPNFQSPPAPDVKSYTAKPAAAAPGSDTQQQHLMLGQKLSGAWWQVFDDKRLDDVLNQAIAGSQTLAAARATLAQASETIAQAAGTLYPQLDVNAGYTREQSSEATLALPRKTAPFNLYTIGPTVSYALDPFGGNRRRLEEQQASATFQRYQLDAAYLTLTGNAVTQAITIASLREQIAAVDTIIAGDKENLRLVLSENEVGEATQLDIETAEAQLDTDRTLLPPLRQQLAVSRHALTILLGKLPPQWTPPDFDLGKFTLPKDLPVTIPSELVRRRPDIMASEAQLHAASAAIGVAAAQLYPSLNLSASFTQEALSTAPLFTDPASIWSVGAQLLAPVFHGGSLRAQKRAAIDAYGAALATYRQTVLTAFAQVADVLEALTHDAEQFEAERRALATAETSLELTRTLYQAGNVILLQVIDAQRLAEQARLGYVRAEAQRFLDTVQFFTAMGGGALDWNGGAKREEAAPHRTAPATTLASFNLQPNTRALAPKSASGVR